MVTQGSADRLQTARHAHQGIQRRSDGSLLTAQEPLQLRNTITISPKGGLHVRVVPRGLEPEA